MLELSNVTKNFGGLCVLKRVSFTLGEGEFVGLIGPNGSGKTTLFNIIAGSLHPDGGKVTFYGRDITGFPPNKICRLGIARTFQIPRPIKTMSVVENVMLGIFFGQKNSAGASRSSREVKQEAFEYLNLTGLQVDEWTMPHELTAAALRRLELARALATKPQLLLVDEFMSGLNALEVLEASAILKRIRGEKKITIIWIEHVMESLMNLVERVIVLNYGELIAEGKPAEISKDKRVIEVYLGEDL
ncbi:MAG: ABC transporter ATP-binding protein [Bacillota bacterium]